MKKYQNSNLSPEERAADLLSRMTLDEKLSQMVLQTQIYRSCTPDNFLTKYPNSIGATYDTDAVDAEAFCEIQKKAVNDSRLGIPILFCSEAIHGFMCEGATVFPQCIGLGATFNDRLVEEMAQVIGKEAKANGVSETFSPNLDLSRDPRWGRTEENYGEDPYLTGRMGIAYVKGLQRNGVAACLKHYAAHGSPEGGINLAPVHAGERELRDTMLVPFAMTIKEAGPLSIMPAYSEYDGIPLHASHFLLTDILRDELGFRGFTVSDFGAVRMMHDFHRIAENAEKTGVYAIRAGVDVEAPRPWAYGPELKKAVAEKAVDIALIDQAVFRLLYVKFALGLFENPYPVPNAKSTFRSETAVKLSQTLAEESVVLLKNENNLLPLRKDCGKIALIGPSVKQSPIGDYAPCSAAERAVTIFDAVSAAVGAENVLYARGCGYAYGSEAEFSNAVRAAQEADVVIAVLGDNSNYFGGIGWGDEDGNASCGCAVTCGEGFDMSDLDLPGRQQELLERLYATGKPIVLLLATGRPYAISWANAHIPAIMQIWYPGESGGTAVSNLLFGDVNPSGKLPISFPQSVGHLPCFYNHKVSARGFYKEPGRPDFAGRDYVFSSPQALYPFGYGLSYTTFRYSNLTVSPKQLRPGDKISVSVDVENCGCRSGKEAVLLYLTDDYARITPFVKQLKEFRKIQLLPGERKTVHFVLPGDCCSFINEKMQPEIEPGTFTVQIGDQTAVFEIV